LPLLLVRDAIAPNSSGAPVSCDEPFKLPGHAAHYTRRVLRSGFVNVYDEARKRWEAYNVTKDGYFFKMPLKPGVIPIKPNKPFTCSDLGHRALASCITVPDPSKATLVWIGFSDVLWTEAVREKNAGKAWREKHMICIDVRKMMAGAEQKHCRPVKQVSAVVAEYAMNATKGSRVFNWSPFSFYEREKRAERLITECDTLRKDKGQIVTIPDPAGVAQELGQLMRRNVEFFNRDPGRGRMVSADAAITALEAGVREQAVMRKIQDDEEQAKYEETPRFSRAGPTPVEVRRQRAAALRDVTPAEAKEAADDAWADYSKKFNGQARNQWKLQHAKNLKAYEEKWVTPLAATHVAVMKSESMLHYFDCNYDRHNLDSGGVFTKVFSQCLLNTQDKKPCADLSFEWLSGECGDTKNLLLRALVFDQKEVVKKVESASSVSIDWRTIPWDNLIGMFNEATEKMAAGGYDALSNLLVTLGGVIARMAGLMHRGKFGLNKAASLLMGMLAGHPAMKLEVTDKRINFRRMVAKELIRRSGLALDPKKLSQAVGAELTLQGVSGKVLQGNVRTTWVIFIDDKIPGIDPSLSDAEKMKLLTASIRTAASVEQLNLGRFKTVINSNVRLGILGAIFQYAALVKLLEDEAKADRENKVEVSFRLGAGALTLASTTADILTNGFKGATLLKYGSSHVSSGIEMTLKVTKVLGVVASLIVACADLYQAFNAFQEGQRGMAALYVGAAVAGATLSLFLAFPAYFALATIPVIGWLFAAVIVIGILIEIFKDNALQDWLERTCWGILPDKRYRDEAEEQAAYKAALKG
jgi:hypothetical protein